MMSVQNPESPAEKPGRWARLGLVLAGIVLGQVVLYGPSLAGTKILLPLDILSGSGVYLPRTPEIRALPIENIYLSDLIYVAEPARRFAVAEFQAGRLPAWAPFEFAGTPFLGPKFSPIFGLQYTTASPRVLPWTQMVAALVAGLGAYAFCRRALRLSFWPAAVAAWCYPLTGFFVFWQGLYTEAPVCWLPWMLLAVEETVRGRGKLAAPGLALATAATLLSGALDIAGQVLLASGLYALWAVVNEFRRERGWPQARKAVLSLAAAWGLGFLIAAPYVLPVVEYSQTGSRLARRSAGNEERPPTGLSALPQVVLPDMYGAFGVMKLGSFRISGDSQQESSAAAYAGLAATLLAAPLAWCDRRRRSLSFCLLGLALLSLGWSLNVPGLVELLRMPGLNMLSHNRFVFVAAFALVVLAAMGLEVFRQGPVEWRRWLWAPPLLVAGVYVFCCYRALFLPEPIASQLEQTVRSGRQIGWIRDVESVRLVQDWFVRQFTAGAVLSGLTLAAWAILRLRKSWQVKCFFPLAALMLGDLLWFGCGRSVQSDPSLYFPKVPALEQTAAAGGRVIGVKCLPATLAAMSGLNDVRGYDAVDPAAYVELLQLAADPAIPALPYALTQWLSPVTSFTPDGQVRLSPVLDLLGVRHAVFRGAPPPEAKPEFQSTDYWVARNPSALPRAFVPERVELAHEREPRLRKMAAAEFNPRQVAYVESETGLSPSCRGKVELVRETPTRLSLSLSMETTGLVVLADRWDKGWRAWLDGKPVPILRVDHALRGVVAPAGRGTLEFRYEPASFTWGLRLAALAGLLLAAWAVLLMRAPSTAEQRPQ